MSKKDALDLHCFIKSRSAVGVRPAVESIDRILTSYYNQIYKAGLLEEDAAQDLIVKHLQNWCTKSAICKVDDIAEVEDKADFASIDFELATKNVRRRDSYEIFQDSFEVFQSNERKAIFNKQVAHCMEGYVTIDIDSLYDTLITSLEVLQLAPTIKEIPLCNSFSKPAVNLAERKGSLPVPVSTIDSTLKRPSFISVQKQLISMNNINSSVWPSKRSTDEVKDIDEGGLEKKRHKGDFKTASEELVIQTVKQNPGVGSQKVLASYGLNKKVLGGRRGVGSRGFVPPIPRTDNREHIPGESRFNEDVDEWLQNIEPRLIELIKSEIMDHGASVTWDDIAGLTFAKKSIMEIVVLPMMRPDLFTGLRGPTKGLLLFGPPGTGKTLIGKCIASQSKSTFFSISASSLTSKWIGEGEKMVRALFAVAKSQLPAVIFIDEIDSLLTQRQDNEHESTRRIKTEFLIQLDGAATSNDDRILVVGATNRPQELDDAARRRLTKRLYIPLPDASARQQLITNLMAQQANSLTEEHISAIAKRTEGYSGADMANLCREAALEPIRSLPMDVIEHISLDKVRPISFGDFMTATNLVKASVSQLDLEVYLDWNRKYGSVEMTN